MEKTNIGFKAGIILEKLGETGLITIAELARRLNFAADETALAAGWLARENKIFPIDRFGEPSGKPNDFHRSEQSEKEYPE